MRVCEEELCSCPEPPGMMDMCDDGMMEVLHRVPPEYRPTLRLVCRRFRALVDSALCPEFCLDGASHLACGRPTGVAVYSNLTDFLAAAARVVSQRAGGLCSITLDFEAHGCVFASQLLQQQPLPRLRCVELQNAEAQHVAALRSLPRLRSVGLTRHVNGPVTAGPAAELLVAQLAGLPLCRLRLGGYRMLPGVLASVADALPGLEELEFEVERVEQGGRLELAGLPRLAALRRWALHLLGGRVAADGITVSPLPSGASSLGRLSSVKLSHVRPGRGEEEAFWGSLVLLPALRELEFVASGHVMRQPPAALLRLPTLTSLHIAIEGNVHYDDPPLSTWTQLPELSEGALPRLTSLHVNCVGLLGFPASWCKLPLRELLLSGRASERSFYSLLLPDELPQLAGTLQRLELPRCGLLALPCQLAQLTGLTHLGLCRNSVARLPALRPLQRLAEVDLWWNPAANAVLALQGCTALRRLVLGSPGLARRRISDGSGFGYEVDEAWHWEEAWLDSTRQLLPWVQQVVSGPAAPALAG